VAPHDERGGGQEVAIVVAGVAVPQGEVDERVIGVVGRSVLGIGVGDVEARVGGQRAGLDRQVGQDPIPDWRVVEAGLPGVDDRREANRADVTLAIEVGILRD
jgi:hypothetical protein